MKRRWLIPVVGLAAVAAFVAWRNIVVSGDPGYYYRYRHSHEGFVYPTQSVAIWTAIVVGELALVGLAIARAKKPAHASLLGALWFFVVLLATGIFAMHAPPYFAGFVIAQLFACGWLLVATFVVALIGPRDS